MIRLHVRGLLRPAERRKSPESRGKPCVQDVWVLLPAFARRFYLHFGLTVFVPSRNTVTKPYLPRDAPITQVVYPVKIRLLEMLWHYFYAIRVHYILHA